MTSRPRTALLLAPAVLATAVLFGAALAGAVRQSLEPGIGGSLDGRAWREVAGDPAFLDAVGFTARVTLMAVALSALLALAATLLLVRHGSALRSLFALPVPVPHLLIAAVAVLWLAPGGLVDRAAGALPVDLVRDPQGVGVALVYAYKEAPFLALLLLAAMGDAVRERVEAASTLGLGPLRVFRHVLWPAVRLPLAVGSLIVGAFVVGSFEVPLAVGPTYPPTLATYALDATRLDPLAGQSRAAVALLVAAAVSVVIAAVTVALARARRD